MCCRPGQSAADSLSELNAKLGLPHSIAELGYGQADLEELATDALASFFNAASPYRPTSDEYKDILQSLMT